MGCGGSKAPEDKYIFKVDPDAVPVKRRASRAPIKKSTSEKSTGNQDAEFNKSKKSAPPTLKRSRTEASLHRARNTQQHQHRARGKFKRNTTIARNVGRNNRVSPERKRSAGSASTQAKAAAPMRKGEFGWIGRACDISRKGLCLQQFDQEAAAIGCGGCGHVRLVKLRRGTQYFALKCVEKRRAAKNHDITRLLNEKRILYEMQKNPFIVDLCATFQDPFYAYFLMEYVVGGELFTLLRAQKRFAYERAKFYACEILVTLEYLHSKYILYRDLKPENVMIDHYGHIKMVDFGFAKEMNVHGRCFSRLGTPHYLSPEILEKTNKGGYSVEADYWALGCLIFELLAGRAAWGKSSDTKHEVLIRILKGSFSVPGHFSADSKSLCKGMMKSKLEKRLCTLEGIKEHSWFSDVDWGAVNEQRIKPPHRPRIHFPGDRSNFDDYNVEDATQKPKVSALDDALFHDF